MQTAQGTRFERMQQMRQRTKQCGVAAIRLCRTLPRSREGWTIGDQLVRCTTSVGANYRALCCARSRREFAAKLAIIVEEVDESLFWLELIAELDLLKHEALEPLVQEANELVAIFVAAQRTVLRR